MRRLLAGVALIAISCGGAEPKLIKRADEPEVQTFSDEDAEMNAAIGAARASFDRYVAAISSSEFKGAYYSVKVPVSDGKNVEHIWLDSPIVKEGRVTGALGNEPLDLEHVALGPQVDVAVSEISDWMLVRNGELFGGFTLAVQFSHLPRQDQREFLESVGFQVPDTPRIP